MIRESTCLIPGCGARIINRKEGRPRLYCPPCVDKMRKMSSLKRETLVESIQRGLNRIDDANRSS